MGEVQIGSTQLRLMRGDITTQSVDAIVNAANSSLLGGGGVDGAIHRKGGPSILDACRRIRSTTHRDGLPVGGAVATTAGALPAEAVIHTVGPRWSGGERGEAKLLARAYRSSLDVARDKGYRSIAFPSISTGAYGYPVERAAGVALSAVVAYVREHPDAFDEVRFVLFSADDLDTYERELNAAAP